MRSRSDRQVRRLKRRKTKVLLVLHDGDLADVLFTYYRYIQHCRFAVKMHMSS